MKKTLYQVDSKGKTRVWCIETRGDDNYAEIVVNSGVLDGKMVETITPIWSGKNAGRSNATTPLSQADLDAQSEVDKKTTKGYTEDLANARSSATLGSGVPAPMLAHKHDESGLQSGSKSLSKLGLLGKKVYVADKLDGNRCLAHVTIKGAKLYTRKGKPFQPIRHIEDQLTACFRQIHSYVSQKYGTEEYWVDGELFTQRHSFNTVNGVLKKETRTQADETVLLDVAYHVYDVVLPVGYETRYKVLQYFQSSHLRLVASKEIVATPEAVAQALDEALSRGQEGLMIRQLGIPYEHKRTQQLLKCKVFEDAEFEVVGFKQSITGNTLGSIQFKMNDGGTFYASFNGSDEEQQRIWDNRTAYLGRKMTVEYFGMSTPEEGGKPRFPKAKAFRD